MWRPETTLINGADPKSLMSRKTKNLNLMKKIITTVFALLLVLSCYSQDLPPAYPNEITDENGNAYENGIAYYNHYPFTGILVDKKTKKRLGEFSNGQKNGLFVEYYNNGKMKYEGRYVYGIKDGVHSEWLENGNKISSINFLNGNLNGVYSEWYPNGKKKYEGNYQTGNKEGTFTEFYENGNQKSKSEYSSNQLEFI